MQEYKPDRCRRTYGTSYVDNTLKKDREKKAVNENITISISAGGAGGMQIVIPKRKLIFETGNCICGGWIRLTLVPAITK